MIIKNRVVGEISKRKFMKKEKGPNQHPISPQNTWASRKDNDHRH